MSRRMRPDGATPIEEAPIWVLAILTVLLWPVIFAALVGLLNGFQLLAGGGWTVAAVAAIVSLVLVVGLARQKSWQRPTAEHPAAEIPTFARLATWSIVTLALPNVLYGVFVLSRRGEGLDYASAWMIGLLVSAIHGGFAAAARWRRRG